MLIDILQCMSLEYGRQDEINLSNSLSSMVLEAERTVVTLFLIKKQTDL